MLFPDIYQAGQYGAIDRCFHKLSLGQQATQSKPVNLMRIENIDFV